MIRQGILAVLVAAIVYLVVCLFIGGTLLVGTGIPIAVQVGSFMAKWAEAFAVIAGLWYFFSGAAHALGWFQRGA